MLDPDTFLTTLYVAVDDFCKSRDGTARRHPGPAASLSASETVTLALVAQWSQFASERAFYRYAQHHWRGAFPRLPDRAQFNRLVRAHAPVRVAFFRHVTEHVCPARTPYEALDTSAVPTRNAKRRGAGWLAGLAGLAGLADIGWSNRLGWYEGFHLVTAVTPAGVITGFGFGSASAKDQPLAESFFALRRGAADALPSVGRAVGDTDLVDTGFEGRLNHARWRARYGASVVCPPKRTSATPWPTAVRRWLAGLRQIVETVYDKLQHTFRLEHERPHVLRGFQARLSGAARRHGGAP